MLREFLEDRPYEEIVNVVYLVSKALTHARGGKSIEELLATARYERVPPARQKRALTILRKIEEKEQRPIVQLDETAVRRYVNELSTLLNDLTRSKRNIDVRKGAEMLEAFRAQDNLHL